MNKRTLLSLMMLLIAFTGVMRAQELTVHDGTTTNSYVPFYGLWVDDYTRSEMIYPADELADMAGANINSLTFYKSSSTTTTSWGATSFQVYLKEVSNTTLSAYIGMTDATIVYEGGIDAAGGEIQVTINFTTPYYYNGGNLLVGIYQTVTGSYSGAYWYGENVSNASASGYDSSNPANATFNQRNFLPKTTFTYDSCQVPTGLTVTNTTATSATLSWTENGDSESWYIYYRPDSPSPTPLPYDSVPATMNPFTLTGLVTNAHYEAFVVPACGVGTADFYQFASNTVDFTPADFYNITVSASPANAGTITGGGEYSFGDTCTLTLTSNLGYTLASLEMNGSIVEYFYYSGDVYEYIFTVTESANFVANFEPRGYGIWMIADPYDGGEVERLDSNDYYAYLDDTITIRATSNPNYRFLKWTVSGQNSRSLRNEMELTTDSVYTLILDANFLNNLFADVETSDFGEYRIELTAHFIGGIGDCIQPLDFSVTEVGPNLAKFGWTELGTSQAWIMYYRPAYTAEYVPYDSLEVFQNPYTLTGLLQPNTSYEAYIVPSCGFTDGIANEYLASNTVTFTTLEACPTPMNVEVTNITGTSATVSWNGYSNSYYVQMGLVSIVLNESFGSGIPSNWSNSTDYPWSVVDGHIQSGNAGIGSSTSTISVTATFTTDGAIDFDAECMGEGTGTYWDHCDFSIDGEIMLNAGENLNTAGWLHYSYPVTAGQHTFTWSYTKDSSWDPIGDYFAVDNVMMREWIFDENNYVSVPNSPYTITGMDPTSNYCVRVKGVNADMESEWSSPVFFTTAEAETFTITVTANPAAGGNVSGGGTYMQGASCTLTATANTGYTFVNWTENGNVVSTSPNYSFTVTGDRTLVANFSQNSYAITVTANPTEGGTVTGGGTYNHGQNITLTATANEGYTFTNWTENGNVVSTTPSYSFIVTRARTLVANFSQNSYAITVTANPTEGGTVTGGGTYNHGQNISLTATANTGYTFVNWTENGNVVSTSPNYSFTVTGARTLVANFSQNSYAITVTANPTEGGTVTESATYDFGQTCTLVATANSGYTFVNWTENGNVVSTSPTYSFTVNGARTLVANFSLNAYQITVSANPTDGGTVTESATYDYGQTCTLVATANTGYTFVNWTENGNVVSTSPTYSFTVTGARTLVANFSLNAYQITVSANPSDGGTVTESATYDFGQTCTLVATANTGYTFVNWTENGSVVSTTPTYSFTVNGDRTLVANFSLNAYQITVSANPSDGGTVTESATYDFGQTCTLVATANTGYTFVNWTENGNVVSTTPTYSFTVTGARTLVANFSLNSYTLTINYKYANGATAATSHVESLNYGDSYSVTSPAITGYTPDLAVVMGTMDTENVTVDVTYTINNYTLTINYKYADGTTAAASHTESVNYNATYSVTSPAITGYTPDLAVVTGTMGTENVTVDVTYTINSYTLTVNYLYADGTTAAASHTESVNYNATYSVTSPDITGYTPDLAVVTGTMGTEDVTVDVTYTINSYTLTVNYLYADGTTAAASHTESVNYNATYSVTSPDITGYTPDLAVVTGTMGTEDVTVDVTYTINSYTLTVNYLYADGTTAAASHTESVNYNATYSVTSPAITGYTPDLAVVSGTMGTEDVTVDVTYTINSYTLTINYKYADGTMAAPTHTESVNYNASYSVTSPDIIGYTPDLAVVSGTMGTEDVTVDVTYTINSYVISASANPTVGGNVNGAGTYNHFATAELTATASTGYTFISWTENGTVVSTSPTISFMVEGPRTLVANFQLNSYQITAIANPTVGGTATGTGTYYHFETCTLVATPNEYYVFTNWTKNGQVVSDNATYSFTVEGGGTYVAHFTRVNHQITALANPTEGGSVSGTGSYPHGSYCTLTATANTGYTFFNWTKNGQVVSSNPSYSFSVTEDATYVANFNLNNYTITVSADPTVGGTVSGGGAYLYGNSCTVSAMANSGYTFTNWTKNGTVVSTDAAYTFTVTEEANLVAHFSLDHYNITVSVDPEVGGIATGGGSFTYGETCNLTATPNTGYAFVNWTKNGSVVSNNANYSFTVTDNGDYVAHFAVARYTITLVAQPAEGGSVHGAGTYDFGHVVTLRAIAHEGYEFINWTRDGAVVSSNANYPIVVREDAEYVANFRPYVFEIKANTDPDNTGDIEGVGYYNYGETCTLTVTPHAEYEFLNWTLNGEVVSEEESISFVVTEARDYVAHLQHVEGIDEQSNLSVTLHPNPAKFRLNIEASEPIKMLEIYTIDGALVSKQDYSSDKIVINVDTFASGTYMIRLTTYNTVETRRFVKE